MKQPSRLDYAFAIGRIRVLERDLVSRAVFREAADERDASSAMKMIFDAGSFLDEMTGIKSSDDLDLFLANEERQLLKTLSEILIEKELMRVFTYEVKAPMTAFSIAQKLGYSFILDYFRHRIDLGNLKIYFRAKYLGLSQDRIEKYLMTGGFYSPDLLLDNFDLSFSEIAEKIRNLDPYFMTMDQLKQRIIEICQRKEKKKEFKFWDLLEMTKSFRKK